MKHQILALSFLSLILVSATTRMEAQGKFFNRLMDNSIVLYEDGLVRGTKEVKGFVSDFGKANGKGDSYESTFNVKVNDILDFEAGEIETNSGAFSVMFLKRKDKNDGIEFLVIYKKSNAEDQAEALDKARTKWMELCNAHQAGELVKQLYTSDAYYYNRGRLLQGTAAITQEYGYMNSSSYSLKLTPKHVSFITPEIAYEIGRCSGSYPLPYMLLWQKQDDGNWQVLMDSNY